MSSAHDYPLLNQILEAIRVVTQRLDGDRHIDDPLVADAVLWRISLIGQAAQRLSPALMQRHSEVDWHGVRRLHLVADGTLGGLTRDEVWRTAADVIPALGTAIEHELANHDPASAEAQVRARRVLLVDDDADIRRILDLLLSHAGYEVIEASDGVEALERAREARPDAVVADVQMPNIDGIQLVRKLREMPEMEGMVVLLFTGKPPQGDLHDVLSLDRVRYMSKGDPQRVIAALEAMFAEASSGSSAAG